MLLCGIEVLKLGGHLSKLMVYSDEGIEVARGWSRVEFGEGDASFSPLIVQPS